jgi:hypothetical protein
MGNTAAAPRYFTTLEEVSEVFTEQNIHDIRDIVAFHCPGKSNGIYPEWSIPSPLFPETAPNIQD